MRCSPNAPTTPTAAGATRHAGRGDRRSRRSARAGAHDCCATASVVARDGSRVPLRADTLCLHGDRADAAGFARALRKALDADGVADCRTGSASHELLATARRRHRRDRLRPALQPGGGGGRRRTCQRPACRQAARRTAGVARRKLRLQSRAADVCASRCRRSGCSSVRDCANMPVPGSSASAA